MKTNLNFLTMLLVSALLLTRCKEDAPVYEYTQQGFVEGTISGTASDDLTPIQEKFRHTQYSPLWNSYSYYHVREEGDIDIHFSRYDFNTGSYIQCWLYLENADVTALDTGDCLFHHATNGKEIISVDIYTSFTNTLTFSSIDFDIATGRFKSDFILQGAFNSANNEVIVIGKVDVTLREFVE